MTTSVNNPRTLYTRIRCTVPASPALADLMDNPTSNWLTATEAAAYLKVEARTLLMWARQGTVKGYVLSGTLRQTWRFLHADLDATLTAPSVATKRRIQ